MRTANAIELSGVGKDYPHFTLDDIDLSVSTGTVMGFVGPNGAGKSTTLRIIMGLVHQDRGKVEVLGHSMPEEQVAAKWDIGFVSEDMRLHPTETIGFHIDLMKSVYPNWDEAYATELVRRFELIPEQQVKGLSHGQRVKAALLLALARKPSLLVFDEPTTGLDPVARKEIIDEMSLVLADESRTIIFSSHNTLDIEQISDEITFISGGKVLFSEDKERMGDRWRRIRYQSGDGFQLPELKGVVEHQSSGHIGALVTQNYCPRYEEALSAAGAQVTGVELMTLEEIFLASVTAQGDSNE